MSPDSRDTKLIIPVSAVMATMNRAHMVRRTVENMAEQSSLPMELIIIDASSDDSTKRVVEEDLRDFSFKIIYVRAVIPGAATQRMQGVDIASQSTIWFLDDDILMEAECTKRIWDGFRFRENVGAVNAMIINQRYTIPGLVSRIMFRLMHGKKLPSYAGKVIGPAWNLLPEDEEGMREYVECEWLNTTCTMYLKSALPNPIFQSHFKGYSLMEDLSLSLIVGRTKFLLNARTARIFHDSQPGFHKNNITDLSQMELINRYYVMTKIMNRTGILISFKFLVFQIFGLITSLSSDLGRKSMLKVIHGKLRGFLYILKYRNNI